MANLRILTGDNKGKKFEIDRDEIVIGRAAENVVPIPEPAISGKHCAIVRDGRKFTVKDLGSTNGTRLNGVVVKEYQLSPKDIITVGSVDIQFDGTDIEPAGTPAPSPTTTGPQVTVRISPPPTSLSTAPSTAFSAKKDGKWLWISIAAVFGIVVLGALVFFLIRLSGVGS